MVMIDNAMMVDNGSSGVKYDEGVDSGCRGGGGSGMIEVAAVPALSLCTLPAQHVCYIHDSMIKSLFVCPRVTLRA